MNDTETAVRVALTPSECDSLTAALPDSLQPVGVGFKMPRGWSDMSDDPLTGYGHAVLDPICRAVQSIIAKRVADQVAMIRQDIADARFQMNGILEDGEKRVGARTWSGTLDTIRLAKLEGENLMARAGVEQLDGLLEEIDEFNPYAPTPSKVESSRT